MTDLRPVVSSSSEAQPLPFLATVHRVLIPAAETGGAVSMLDVGVVPEGFSPPMHSHLREHELFTVVSGAVRFVSGATTKVVEGPGAAWLPAGVPHSFEVLSAAQLFVVTVPSGVGAAGDYEKFVQAVSAAAAGGTPDDDELARLVAEVGAQHDISIVGPPLGLRHTA